MARPDPVLLDPARYPFRVVTSTRFADVDPNRHLNNVALAAMMEDGRVRFNFAMGFRDAIAPRRAMVASMGIEYLAQGYFPDPVEVQAAVESVGRTSLVVIQLLTQQGRNVAFARSVIVCIDGDAPSPIPDDFRAALLAQWTLAA
ncbi:MAG: hypothetical protein RLZZ427_546 [Pseudomonadota bacterium]|jgi:acyl-CoA thioester hydrolase